MNSKTRIARPYPAALLTSLLLSGAAGAAPTDSDGGVAPAHAVPVVIAANDRLGTRSSSARHTGQIQDMGEASQGLLRLHPVTFRYQQPTENAQEHLEYGLIAEEVGEVYPDLVVKNEAGEVEAIQYQKLAPLLLNEVQRLSRLSGAQAQELAEIKELLAMQSQALVPDP